MKKLIPLLILSAFCMGSVAQISIEDARNAGEGAKVIVTGLVLNGDELGGIRYIQDSTAAIAVYPSGGSVPLNAVRGDIITVSGTIDPFYELLEIVNLTEAVIHSSGNPLPNPVEITPDQMGDHLEGQLVRFSNITFINASGNFGGDQNYTVSYEGKQGQVRISRFTPIVGTVIPTNPIILTGICSRFRDSYQMLPRDLDDIQQTSPVYFTKVPSLSNLSQTGFDLRWETNIKGSTEILYGNTPALEKGHVAVPGDTTIHNISISGASASELFYIKFLSVSGEDTAITPDPRVYITQSTSSGDVRIYFNREVDHTVSTGVDAVFAFRALDDTLINYINRAQESIDFTIYNYNLNEISNITSALNAAHARGVRVRVIHDGEANNSGFDNLDPSIGKLISPPADFIQNIGIMHNKFIVFDAGHSDPDVPLVWTGSTNFTNNQVNVDPNSVIILQDRSLARAYTLEFNEMYGSDGAQPDPVKSRFGAAKKDDTPHEVIIGDRQVECYFSPSDNVNSRIKETINHAKRDISVATMLITKSDIAYALEDQHEAGVTVRVLVNRKVNCSPASVNALERSLATMFIESTETTRIMHHKYMLVDRTGQDPILWVGCHNWSDAANVRNDENTLIIHDATLVNIYYQEFYERFSSNGGSVGIKVPVSMEGEWSVYPNPVQGKLGIMYKGETPVEAGIEMYDLNGRRILNIERIMVPGRKELELPADTQNGIYILRIRSDKRIETLKLMVQ